MRHPGGHAEWLWLKHATRTPPHAVGDRCTFQPCPPGHPVRQAGRKAGPGDWLTEALLYSSGGNPKTRLSGVAFARSRVSGLIAYEAQIFCQHRLDGIGARSRRAIQWQ